MATDFKASSIVQSFGFAFRGLFTAWRNERNFRVQTLYGGIVCSVLFILHPVLFKTVSVLVSVFVLLAAELANSALERAVDLASPEFHHLAGEAKDMAAAAVMLVSFASAALFLSVVLQELDLSAFLSLGGFIMYLLFVRFRGGIKA